MLIAGSLATPANLYIWDEPLNFVDIISRIQLERLLGANTPTMLLAEHDRYFCENTGTKRLYITKAVSYTHLAKPYFATRRKEFYL